MTQFRFWGLTLLALAVLVVTGRSEEPKSLKSKKEFVVTPLYPLPEKSEEAEPSKCGPSLTCRIYSLAELGDDPELAKWIAETIPEVIEPGSWNRPGTSGTKPVLRHYGPKKILVVYHTPAVQISVESFLKNMKNALPRGKEKTTTAGKSMAKDSGTIPANYMAPALMNTSNPVSKQRFTYPVPPPVGKPKHLFHFIIRYEGEGIIDSNVVKFMKAQNEQSSPKAAEPDTNNPKPPNDQKVSGEPEAKTPVLPSPGYAPVSSGTSKAPGELKRIEVFEVQQPAAQYAPVIPLPPGLIPPLPPAASKKEKEEKY
jgi:hypothetical protein